MDEWDGWMKEDRSMNRMWMDEWDRWMEGDGC